MFSPALSASFSPSTTRPAPSPRVHSPLERFYDQIIPTSKEEDLREQAFYLEAPMFQKIAYRINKLARWLFRQIPPALNNDDQLVSSFTKGLALKTSLNPPQGQKAVLIKIDQLMKIVGDSQKVELKTLQEEVYQNDEAEYTPNSLYTGLKTYQQSLNFDNVKFKGKPVSQFLRDNNYVLDSDQEGCLITCLHTKLSKDIFESTCGLNDSVRAVFKDVTAPCLIGRGGFGIVFAVAKNGETLALKAPIVTGTDDMMPMTVEEHPSVLRPSEVILFDEYKLQHQGTYKAISMKDLSKLGTERRCCFVYLPLMQGSLMDLIVSRGGISAELAKNALKTLSRGVEFLHEKEIYHRDLKPENLLVKDGQFKITDFGLATRRTRETEGKYCAGTPAYLPPEASASPFKGMNSAAQDIWAMGIVLCDILYGLSIDRTNHTPLLHLTELAKEINKTDGILEGAFKHDPNERAPAPKIKALAEPIYSK